MRGDLVHGRNYSYSVRGCRCRPCRDAHRRYHQHWTRRCRGDCEWCNPPTFVLADFPVAIVARQAFPDDTAAIATLEGAP